MGAKKKDVPIRGYYDPRCFDRKLLPHDSALEVPVRAPHRGSMVPQCNIVSKLVAMCRATGIEVTEDDFNKYKVRRRVRNPLNPRYEVRTVLSGQLYVMYQDVRHGMMHPLFVQILAAAGWHQQPNAVAVHRPLPMTPRKRKLPDPAQLDLYSA